MVYSDLAGQQLSFLRLTIIPGIVYPQDCLTLRSSPAADINAIAKYNNLQVLKGAERALAVI